MVTLTSHSPEETAALGEQWGRAARWGLVIGLSGDLGAGKTELVKGIARGLGVTDRVHSPTFVLLNQYRGGRLPLFHLDLNRLETTDQIMAAGLDDYLFQPAGLAVVEWAERWFQANRHAEGPLQNLPPRYRRVQLEMPGRTERRISYEDFGA